ADGARFFAAITQRETKRVVSLTWLNPDRTRHRALTDFYFHQLTVFKSQVSRGFATHEHHVVPNHLGDRVGHFLEPAVIILTAVIHAVIRVQNDFEFILGSHVDL